MTQESNPYQAPATLEVNPAEVLTEDFYRQGKFLIARTGAELPPVCLRTNRPTSDLDWRKTKTFTWCPRPYFLLILINILLMLLVMLIVQKKMKMTYSLCPSVRNKILLRNWLGVFLLISSIAAFVGFAIEMDAPVGMSGVLGIYALVALIAGLVFLIIANPIKVAAHKKGWFSFSGCSPDFLDTLPDFPS